MSSETYARLAQLAEAAEQIQKGRGAIISISGDAGTGKSRLVEEFRAGLDLDNVQWLEGHAYAYSQNMPYFQLELKQQPVIHTAQFFVVFAFR